LEFNFNKIEFCIKLNILKIKLYVYFQVELDINNVKFHLDFQKKIIIISKKYIKLDNANVKFYL